MQRDEVAGLVLAGGRSRRFGADKATALLAGRPLIAWSLASLDAVADAVAVSAPPGSDAARLAERLGRPVLADARTHPTGPLAGVAAGLAWAAASGRRWLATLPCDTPLVTPDIMQRLLGAATDGGAYAETADGFHALCAVWRVDHAATLVTRLDADDHPPVRDALAAMGAKPVRFEDASLFDNVNAPADLARLAARLTARR